MAQLLKGQATPLLAYLSLKTFRRAGCMNSLPKWLPGVLTDSQGSRGWWC